MVLLKERTVVVTGGATGIGLAIARRALDEGARVAVWDIARAEAATGLLVVGCNVADEGSVSAAAESTRDVLGSAHVLINNVGATTPMDWSEVTSTSWNETLDINLTGAWLCSRALIPGMLESGCGSIVNVSSIHAQRTSPGHLPYAVSKAALEGLTRSLAVELGHLGIRVNAVAPGWIVTERVADYLDPNPAIRGQLEGLHALRRLGRPDEVAAAAIFLASDESSFITGSILTVDGGFAARLATGGEDGRDT